MSLRFSQQFTEWMPRAGFTVSDRETDPFICVANGGGEIRFYVRVDTAGRFTLTHAERGDAEQLVLVADDLSDIERFLILDLAGEVQRREGLPRLVIPSREDELAEGFQAVLRDGFVWLDDGRRPSIRFVEEDPYLPQPAVQFSHYANASVDELISFIDGGSDRAEDSPVPGGPLSEDVHGNLVGDSLYYSDQTERPVAYLSVIRDQTVLGYLWANDEDQAAGYIPRSSAGDDAFNAGVAWSQRLREAKARGLTPARALAELASFVGNARIGRASSAGVRVAESLDALRALGAE